jgi:hypothetical protein
MAVTFAQLAQEAQTLSPQERARLVEVLLESLRDTEVAEIEAVWEREIADRVAARMFSGRTAPLRRQRAQRPVPREAAHGVS